MFVMSSNARLTTMENWWWLFQSPQIEGGLFSGFSGSRGRDTHPPPSVHSALPAAHPPSHAAALDISRHYVPYLQPPASSETRCTLLWYIFRSAFGQWRLSMYLHVPSTMIHVHTQLRFIWGSTSCFRTKIQNEWCSWAKTLGR